MFKSNPPSIEPGIPVILADEDPKTNKLRVMLFRHEYNQGHYGIVIADIIRHTAKALRISEDEVIKHVAQELNKPTSALKELFNINAQPRT